MLSRCFLDTGHAEQLIPLCKKAAKRPCALFKPQAGLLHPYRAAGQQQPNPSQHERDAPCPHPRKPHLVNPLGRLLLQDVTGHLLQWGKVGDGQQVGWDSIVRVGSPYSGLVSTAS